MRLLVVAVLALLCTVTYAQDKVIEDEGVVKAKAKKPEYEALAKKPFPASCLKSEIVDFAMFCVPSAPGVKLPSDGDKYKRHPIICTKPPAGWDACKKEFADAANAKGPTAEETKDVWPMAEGHKRFTAGSPMAPRKGGVKGANGAKATKAVGAMAPPSTPAAAAALVELKAATRSKVHLPFWAARRWSHRTISYCYSAGVGVMMINRFYQGLQLISGATNIRFRHAECNAPGHKLQLTQVVGYANSFVGCTVPGAISAHSAADVKPAPASTSQAINFDPAAFSIEAAAHEVIHGLGFEHAHQSGDRDTFVDIQNPIAVGAANYAWCDRNIFQNYPGAVNHGKYDYNSIMHYPQWVAGTCSTAGAAGKMFIQSVPAPAAKLYAGNPAAIGPSAQPTAEDANAINSAYNGVALE